MSNHKGLFHEFFLLEERAFLRREYMQELLQRRDKALRIHDSIIMYLRDTFLWIPSENPAHSKEWPGFGLNLYGETFICRDGAKPFQDVCTTWANLFELGPKQLELTGSYMWDTNDQGQNSPGYYEKITIDRDVLVSQLRILAAYAEKAQSGQYVIAHFGL